MEISWANMDEVYRQIHSSIEDTRYEEFCETTKPKDYYFQAFDEDGETHVYIVAKDYYDKHGHMFDQSMMLEHILPDHMCEIMESVWASDFNVEEVINEMKELGFTLNETLESNY